MTDLDNNNATFILLFLTISPDIILKFLRRNRTNEANLFIYEKHIIQVRTRM